MKPVIILGAAVVSGILVFFIQDEVKRKKLQAKLSLEPEGDNKSETEKVSVEDLDLKVRELRKSLRHAERERRDRRNQSTPNSNG